jgi:hypothetical protein
MHYVVSIIDVVLSDKENYPKWSRNIEHTLIFNDLWDHICDGDTSPIKPIVDKELVIWTNTYKKEYPLIVVSVNEEVSRHINSIKYSCGDLKELKDLYDSHS